MFIQYLNLLYMYIKNADIYTSKLPMSRHGVELKKRSLVTSSGVMSQNIWGGGAQSLRGSEATKPEGA